MEKLTVEQVAYRVKFTDIPSEAVELVKAYTLQETASLLADIERWKEEYVKLQKENDKLKEVFEEIVNDYAKHVTYTPYDFEEFVSRCKVLAGLIPPEHLNKMPDNQNKDSSG